MFPDLFRFTLSPWELVIRGTLIYWFLFLLFRFILRRDAGSVGLADILVIVLIADAAQNGMAGDSKSVGEAMVLIGTIAGWNLFIDWMSFRYQWFLRFAQPRLVPLVRHGRVLRDNLQKEMLTEDDLESQLRHQGIEDLSEVKYAALEADGSVSVIRYSHKEMEKKRQRRPGAA